MQLAALDLPYSRLSSAVMTALQYMVRQGCTSWLVFYQLEVKGAADAGAAALTVSGEADSCNCRLHGPSNDGRQRLLAL